jgi:hypothetical protein
MKKNEESVNPFTHHWINWENSFQTIVERLNSASFNHSPLLHIIGVKGGGKSTFIGHLCRSGKIAMDGDMLRVFAAARFWWYVTSSEHSINASLVEACRLDAKELEIDDQQLNRFVVLIGSDPTLAQLERFFVLEGNTLWNWEMDARFSEFIIIQCLFKLDAVSSLSRLSHQALALFSTKRTMVWGLLIPNYRQYEYNLKKRNAWVARRVHAHGVLTMAEFLGEINETLVRTYSIRIVSEILGTVKTHLESPDPQRFENLAHEKEPLLIYMLLPHDYSPAAFRSLQKYCFHVLESLTSKEV